MKKLIPVAAAALLAPLYGGLLLAVYGDLPHSGNWESYQVAFVMIETPLLIGMLLVMSGAVYALWRAGQDR